MKIDLSTAIKQLKSADDVVILLHQFPDGDTVGSGYALYSALTHLGKRARVECAHAISKSMSYITDGVNFPLFTPKTVVAVDVADAKLLGDKNDEYPKIDLCIDHHESNTHFADNTYVDSTAAATCEIIAEIIKTLCGEISKSQATALYTGIATDTGCFKFSNTTPQTFRTAADLVERGVDTETINRIMFDTKTRARIQVEKEAMESIKYFADGKIAIMTVTKQMRKSSGVGDGELEGLTALPRQIEGVLMGITIRERDNTDLCKVSVRTHPPVSASEFCKQFGGGGHPRAAGCELLMRKEEALDYLSRAAIKTIEQLGIDK